jgi:hypothetical protein
VAQIEQARESQKDVPEAARLASEARSHRREAIGVAMVLAGGVAGWAGTRLILHIEDWVIALAGLALLIFAAVVWKLRT